MNKFGRSMNESEFHLVLFKPSTPFISVVGNQASSSAKVICRVSFRCQFQIFTQSQAGKVRRQYRVILASLFSAKL